MLVGHVLDHVSDHMLDHVLDHVYDHRSRGHGVTVFKPYKALVFLFSSTLG